MADMFFISGNDAARLVGAKGNPEVMDGVMADIRRAARDREVACPDESRLPTGTLRQAGFIMMKPDDFYAAARAARQERQTNRPNQPPTAHQQFAVPGRTFPEAVMAIATRQPLSGKTARDRANGVLARRAENKAQRDAACQARRGRAGVKPNPGKQTA